MTATAGLDRGGARPGTRETSTLLGSILPEDVESEERFGATRGGVLFPEEMEVVAHAVERRRHEYATVRDCARACLGRLGFARVALLPGVGGAPVWPAGVRGSMTHCTGYAAAAVGPAQRISAIGIDAEPDAPLPDGVLSLVATPDERASLAVSRMLPGDPHWDRLLFSAKEAVYKAWFPLVGEWLDPQETEIVFDEANASFTATLSHDGLVVDGSSVSRLHGRWAHARGILLTAVVREQPHRSQS